MWHKITKLQKISIFCFYQCNTISSECYLIKGGRKDWIYWTQGNNLANYWGIMQHKITKILSLCQCDTPSSEWYLIKGSKNIILNSGQNLPIWKSPQGNYLPNYWGIYDSRPSRTMVLVAWSSPSLTWSMRTPETKIPANSATSGANVIKPFTPVIYKCS
jgi:hypothetical protein